MADDTTDFQEKQLEPMRVAGLRMRGPYTECGKGFAKLGRKVGFKACGKPMMLCYDSEYKPNDADFEVCMPVRGCEDTDDIRVYELPGGRCISCLHYGPYDTLPASYERLLALIAERGLEVLRPCREVYLKGPGMIFRGNPKKYVTELQIMVAD